jgi:uncharacterized membrane protein
MTLNTRIIARRIVFPAIILLIPFGALVALAGLSPVRAIAVTITLPFILYVPGWCISWGFLPDVDRVERITASMLCSIAIVTTAMFLLEKTQTPVTGTGVTIAIAAANVSAALAAWFVIRARRVAQRTHAADPPSPEP